MDVVELLKTIYIGDRGCKSILLDGWSSEVKLQVTCISRVRAGAWDYYSDEDIVDGFLVFEGVESISLEPPGHLPNDLINDVAVELLSDSKNYLFVVSVDSVNASGDRVEVKIRITADSIFLEDPAKPGHRISQLAVHRGDRGSKSKLLRACGAAYRHGRIGTTARHTDARVGRMREGAEQFKLIDEISRRNFGAGRPMP